MEHDLHILRHAWKTLVTLVGHKLGQRHKVVDHPGVDRDALGRGWQSNGHERGWNVRSRKNSVSTAIASNSRTGKKSSRA